MLIYGALVRHEGLEALDERVCHEGQQRGVQQQGAGLHEGRQRGVDRGGVRADLPLLQTQRGLEGDDRGGRFRRRERLDFGLW